MKITEGGGNAHEGEYITKVFLTEAEAHAFLENDYPLSPPPMLYALLWWFENKARKRTESKSVVPYKWKPKDVVPLKDFKFEPMPTSSRFVPLRMHFTLGTLTRTWDLALCDDSFAILLYNEDKKELVFTQRFRPATLVGLARHRSPPKTKLEDIDWASQPPEWAYTLEMCNGHHKRGSSAQEIEQRVRECVALKCGIGISFSGDRQRVYYAKVNDSMKLKDWSQFEDMVPSGQKRSFDLVLRHSSVATLLYHTTQKKFVLVKQFRPAVLLAHILRQPENLNKKLSEVEWHKYDASHGYTVELCAGLVDKNIPIVDIAKEEIEEECGYAWKYHV
ncbi:hypothetical protein ANCDUO_07502 [Ancylostoma duodenale]|uniref:Nudix hydrolase domain-containing protein n=1 Tax=Ancylostoma duodenale TaxID=51022 RepID=A0A0C2GYK4_9BILA|nr:hypothetical protein ANCDUO_07502 [Ancylostoma duodenale]